MLCSNSEAFTHVRRHDGCVGCLDAVIYGVTHAVPRDPEEIG